MPQRPDSPAAPSILDLLDLEYIDKNLFRSHAIFEDTKRLFGGQVAAQALYAAGRSVPDGRLPHSLHGYFLREGNALRRTLFRVERDRDGNSFSARRVVAIQDGKVIFNMAASFAVARPSDEAAPAGPGCPASDHPAPDHPDQLHGWRHPRYGSFEFRSAERKRMPTKFWIRCTASLPDDPLVHAAVLTYTTDMSSGLIGMEPEGTWSGASMDHAVWFHRSVRTDDWIWHDLIPQTVEAGRGLYTGAIYDAAGSRVASTAQEALFMRHGVKAAGA